MKKKKQEPKLLMVAEYIRVSSEEQAKTGDSLREQKETLDDYISKHDNMVMYDTYIDGGISGQKIKRDDFLRLMDDVKSGKINCIIFTKLDRWFRNLRHYLNTQAVLDEYSVTWKAVSQSYLDTSTAHGRAFVANSMTWAELEAQNDSERILAVFDSKVRNGEVISGTVPLGYSIQEKHLVPNEQAPAVQAMFDTFRSTSNLTQTMFMLRNSYGISRTQATIRRMLKKEIYIGEYRGNKEYCPPLISREVFSDVQRLLSQNRRQNQKHDYIFARLVRCAECGTAMSAHQLHVSGHKRKDGTRLRYSHSAYRCKRRFDLKLCDNSKVIYESVLERYMIGNLRSNLNKYIADFELREKPAIDISAKRRILENKIEKLKELYINDLITLDEFRLDRAKYLDQIDQLPPTSSEKKDLQPIRNLLDQDIENIYSKMSIPEKSMFWRSVVKEIRIGKDRNIEVIFL